MKYNKLNPNGYTSCTITTTPRTTNHKPQTTNHKMNSYGSVSLVSAAIYKLLRFMNWFPPTPNVDAICIVEPSETQPPSHASKP